MLLVLRTRIDIYYCLQKIVSSPFLKKYSQRFLGFWVFIFHSLETGLLVRCFNFYYSRRPGELSYPSHSQHLIVIQNLYKLHFDCTFCSVPAL